MNFGKWATQHRTAKKRELEQDMLYDDSNKTLWQKTKGKIKNYWDLTKWPLALVATVGTIYGAGKMSQAEVVPLSWRDFNNDGIQDAVVVFPIKGTDKGLLGYLDGKSIASQAQAPPSLLPSSRFQTGTIPVVKASFFNFTSLGDSVPSSYNSRETASLTFIGSPYPDGQYWARRSNEFVEITKELDPNGTYLIQAADEFGWDSIIGKIK